MDQQQTPEVVAVDQAATPPKAVGGNGQEVPKRIELPLFATDAKSAMKLARSLAAMGYQETANRVAATVGQGEVKVGIKDKHPVLFGIGVGVLGVGALTGAGFGIRYIIRRRRASQALLQTGGKVVRMAAR